MLDDDEIAQTLVGQPTAQQGHASCVASSGCVRPEALRGVTRLVGVSRPQVTDGPTGGAMVRG